MSPDETLKRLLLDLAAELDSPEGPGSGAICLDALSLIEEYEQQIRPSPAEPQR